MIIVKIVNRMVRDAYGHANATDVLIEDGGKHYTSRLNYRVEDTTENRKIEEANYLMRRRRSEYTA